jgi:AAA+ superfamily predicted ATPase
VVAFDPSVLSVLQRAVADDPRDVGLRAHLAELLAAAGDDDEAVRHARQVLVDQPDHLPMLRLLAATCARLGDPMAAAYERMAVALGSTDEPLAPTSATGPHREGDVGDDADGDPVRIALGGSVPDTVDELVDRWDDASPMDDPELGELGMPVVRLADVGGLEAVKERLTVSFLAPLRNPELRAMYGKSLRGGLLLWGPPGCGKTFIARATAGELGASFYAVGLAEVLDMWVGSSERNIASIFEVARRNRPCVLFFDELDALGHKRSQLRGGGAAMRGVVNQLLAELDGIASDNEGLFVLGATNHPWDVDPALLRPGRFDRKLLVLPPDRPARLAILRVALRGRPTEDVDLEQVARRTDGLTGADLGLICESATEHAMTDSLRTGVVRPIRQQDLARATKEVRTSIGPWLDTARNFALYNNEGSEYDELLAYLKRAR